MAKQDWTKTHKCDFCGRLWDHLGAWCARPSHVPMTCPKCDPPSQG